MLVKRGRGGLRPFLPREGLARQNTLAKPFL
jgi:hypothetical protein